MNLAEAYLVYERIQKNFITLSAGMKQLEAIAGEANLDLIQLKDIVLAGQGEPVAPTPAPDKEAFDFVVEDGNLWGHIHHLGEHHNPNLTVGIKGHAGEISIGDGYNEAGCLSGDIQLRLVGLDEHASITINHLGNKFGYVNELQLTSLGIRGRNDSFILRQTGPLGHFGLDDCWWIPYVPGQVHTSALSLAHGVESFIHKNHRYRPDVYFREHNDYLKGGDYIRLEGNHLEGNNRTGMQARPHRAYENQPLTTRLKAIDLLGNISRHGGHHILPMPSGGQWLTVWQCDGLVRVMDNICTDYRMGCFGAVGQAAHKAHLLPSGYQIKRVVMGGNIFHNPNGDRHCVEFSGCEDVVILPGNDFNGPGPFDVILMSEWALKNLAKPDNMSVRVVPGALDPSQIGTWDEVQGRYVQATPGEDYIFTNEIAPID